MSTLELAKDFSCFVAGLPDEERQQHIDILYDRWRQQALAEEDFQAVEESLHDYRQGERGRPHAQVMRDLRAKISPGSDE